MRVIDFGDHPVTTLDITQERMGPHMLKVHVPGLGVLHHFTAPDLGDYHDHPWEFRSTILKGSYVEEILLPDGRVLTAPRHQNDSFIITAGWMHRIIELPEGQCWTCIEVLTPKVQEPAFYRHCDGHLHRRQWNESCWSKADVLLGNQYE